MDLCLLLAQEETRRRVFVIGQELIEIMELWIVLGLSKDYSDFDN